MTIAKRVRALEKSQPDDDGHSGISHRLIQHVGQTEDEALDLYGRDKIGPRDMIVIHRIVDMEPKPLREPRQ